MNTLYDVITTVIEKPELYIGKRSVQRLYAFIGGFLHGNELADDHCLDGFNEYIATRYNIKSSHNWACIIEFFSDCNGDEIALFREHFLAFCRDKRDMGDG